MLILPFPTASISGMIKGETFPEYPFSGSSGMLERVERMLNVDRLFFVGLKASVNNNSVSLLMP